VSRTAILDTLEGREKSYEQIPGSAKALATPRKVETHGDHGGDFLYLFGFVSESIDGPWYPWSCLATNSGSQNSTDERVIQSFPEIRRHHFGYFLLVLVLLLLLLLLLLHLSIYFP
jgi:hypothetical protein